MEGFISEEVEISIEAAERVVCSKLRSLRVQACIALDEFAEALGVETAELESYENGIANVPASVIALVCTLSGKPYEYFFGEEDVAPNKRVVARPASYEECAALLSQ